MVERARRLRMGLAHSSPGVSGDTARPNYVGPSGNGLVRADERGGKPAESRAYRLSTAPVRLQKASRGLRKNAAVERREVNALRTGVRRKALIDTRAFRRSAPLTSLVRSIPPRG